MAGSLKGKVAVVIPAYNEEKSIAAVVEKLRREFPEGEVIVVDDGSRDGTWRVMQTLPVWKLRHVVNLGQGGALQTGISFAARNEADFVVTFDADGQHRATDIPRLLAPLREGRVDVVLGSRFLENTGVDSIPLKRRLLLRLATLFTRVTTGLKLTDTHNGLRAFRADVSHRFPIEINGMAHASEILEKIGRSGVRWMEVPVTIDYTEYSRAKGQRASNMFNILWDLVGR